MMRNKIVSRKTVPIGDTYFLYLEKDSKDKIHCTMYEKNCHMTQREIAKASGIAEPVVCLVMKRSLKKFYNTIKRNNRNLNPIEVTALVGEMLNVKTDEQFKRYFRALPEDIKKEVSRYAIENKYN